jgi:hypothetical protein
MLHLKYLGDSFIAEDKLPILSAALPSGQTGYTPLQIGFIRNSHAQVLAVQGKVSSNKILACCISEAVGTEASPRRVTENAAIRFASLTAARGE